VRPDQTDPGINTPTRGPASTSGEITARTDTRDRAAALPPRERFVDDPAGAIAAAEELVHRALEQRMRALRAEADGLCAKGKDEESKSTEGMRTRLIRYQEYCERSR
jgi:hypothetical protein